VNGWSDFVFAPDYELMPLAKVEQYIAKEHHLPNVPSEAEVRAQGIDIAEMNAILLRKIEENTLYLLQMKKENEVLRAEINQMKSK
jgi:L-2-hydroxyglutarate oxidase LhgO